MKIRSALAALILTSLPQAGAAWGHKPKVNRTVAKIHKLFIKGNNEAATDMRRILAGKTGKLDNAIGGYGNQGGCFTVVGKASLADGILDINEQYMSGGLQERTIVVSATLTNRSGNLIWSESKQGLNGVIHTGAGSAARNVAFALEEASGCRK